MGRYPCQDAFLLGDELQRDAVHAVAQAGRLGAVVEHVAQMPAAAPAVHLGARHEEALVDGRADGVVERLVEARPAGAAVELGGRGEEREVAAGAVVHAHAVLLVERAREGALGAVLAQHVVLLRGQELLPLLVGLGDLERLGALVACAVPLMARRAAAATAAAEIPASVSVRRLSIDPSPLAALPAVDRGQSVVARYIRNGPPRRATRR